MAKNSGETRAGQPKEMLVGPDGETLTSPAGSRWTHFESITVSTTALRLPVGQAAGAGGAFITVATAAVRFRVDGQAPSATVGHVADIAGVIELDSPSEVERFRVIRRDATDAVLSVSYRGQ